MNNLQNRTAIVTGGGTGIGRSTVLALAREGVRVAVCGRRREPLGSVEEEITSVGGTGLAIQADLTQEEDVERVVNEAVTAFGTVDILVSNAGIAGSSLIHEHSVKLWDDMMAGNRNQPEQQRIVTVEGNGKTHRAKYHVKNETVTVEAMSAAAERIATQVREWNAYHVAQALLTIMIDVRLL